MICGIINVLANKQLIQNNEINLKKKRETHTWFSAVVGGQHIVKLTTSPFAPKISLKIYFTFWLYLIPGYLVSIFYNNSVTKQQFEINRFNDKTSLL